MVIAVSVVITNRAIIEMVISVLQIALSVVSVDGLGIEHPFAHGVELRPISDRKDDALVVGSSM